MNIMEICSFHDIAEILLKLTLNTNQSINRSIDQSINQSMYIIIKRPMCHVRVHIRNNCNYIYIHITLKSLSLTTLKVVCSNLRYTGYNIILQSFSGTHRRSIIIFGYTCFPPPMKQHGHNNITKIYC